VTDVAGVARRAVEEPPAADDTATDSRRHHHAEDVVLPPPGPAPVLADDERDRIVVQADGDAGRQRPQPVEQREVPPGGDVQRRHDARRPAHRAAAADTDAGDVGVARHPFDQRRHGGEQALRVERGRRRDPLLHAEPAARVDEPGRELRATDVQGEHGAVRHGGLLPFACIFPDPSRARTTRRADVVSWG